MKLFLLLAVLEGFVALSYGIVCPHDICSRIKCDLSAESNCVQPNHEYRPNAGFCGCCGVCFFLLGNSIV